MIVALRNQRADRDPHVGLLLQRYLSETVTGDKGNPDEKRAIFAAAIKAVNNADVRELYRLAFARWSASLPTDPAPVTLATQGRLIVGLGTENVLETGIRLHHTYGMPIIPGSALKGLAAHYCHQVWGAGDESFRRDGVHHRILFGTTDDSGCILFHDAWITADSQNPLVLDVMTPHHPKWLDGEVPPTDFDSPVPVPFLSVTGRFCLAVSWHGPDTPSAKNWTELAKGLLCDALREWGVGGKTTSGYGRLIDEQHAGNLSKVTPGKSESRQNPSKPGGSVKVKYLGRHDSLSNAHWVQADGKKRGLVKYGQPPVVMPVVESEIDVYPTNSNPNSPEYRWDPPPPEPSKGDSKGQKPRGKR